MDVITPGATTEEIETRVRLYDYSTGRQTFFQWQAGMMPSLTNQRVLELGCGTGALWHDLLPRCDQCELVLTDVSEDMLAAAEEKVSQVLPESDSAHFEQVDLNALPYKDASFDVVIANHNLFYADDIHAALLDIRRVLKSGGQLVCSTIGRDHLFELIALLREFDPELPWSAEQWAQVFGLENGYRLLSEYFNEVDQFEYDNNLHVNAVEPVLAYLQKTMKGRLADWVCQHRDKVEETLSKRMNQRGYLRLTPHSGFFIARH